DFAIDGDYNSYATMRADAGVIFGLGNQPSELELKFSSPVAANTTSYLRIDDDAGLLESLLSGSLGEVVYGIINNVALGDNYFVVRAKNGANTVLEGNSRDGFAAANGLMKIVQDKAGRYYVAISPDVEYTSVEIKAFSESIVGITAEGYNLHVYGMCYETNFDGCSEAFTTSWDGSGLAVGITGIGEYGVVDAFKALDNNNNSDYSTLSLGTLNVAGHIQQNIQFNKELAPHSIVKVRMSVGEGQIDASVFGNMRLVAYNNGADVYNETIENAVIGNVNLAQLFDNGAEGEISFSPGVAFDEVALRLDALVAASVAVPNVRLYYIVEDCTEPEFVGWNSFEINNDPTTTSVSGGETVEYTIHIRNTGTVPVNGFVITDEIPAHTTLVDGSITGSGEVAGGVITWSGIDVPVDGETAVSFVVTVNENLSGVSQISNVAYVKANENDPGTPTFPPSETDPSEPDDTGDTGTDIPVVPTDDIVAWKGYTIDGDPAVTSVSGGEEITYTIYIRNESNQNLTDLSVSDAIPAGTTFVSASNGGEPQGATVEFAGIDIDFGQTASVSFVVRVNDNLTDISA